MTSRRHLYAAGEPLGDGATRRKLGGGLVCGGGGDSSSQAASSTTTNTEYTDSRMVVDANGTGVNSAGGAVQVANTTYNLTSDGNAMAGARDVALAGLTASRDVSITALNENAFNTAALTAATTKLGEQNVQSLALNTSLANDIASAGLGAVGSLASANTASFGKLLDGALSLFKENNKAVDRNLDLTQHLADGAASAYSDATSQANGNKQLLIVGLIVVGVVGVFAFTKGKI